MSRCWRDPWGSARMPQARRIGVASSLDLMTDASEGELKNGNESAWAGDSSNVSEERRWNLSEQSRHPKFPQHLPLQCKVFVGDFGGARRLAAGGIPQFNAVAETPRRCFPTKYLPSWGISCRPHTTSEILRNGHGSGTS